MTNRHPVSPHTRLGRPVKAHYRGSVGASSATAAQPKTGLQARAAALQAAEAETPERAARTERLTGYPLGSDYVECPDCGVTEWSDRASVGDPCSRSFPSPCSSKFGPALSPGESDYADELLEHLSELTGSDACFTEWHPNGGMHEATPSVKRVKLLLESACDEHDEGTPLGDIDEFLDDAQTGSWMNREWCRTAWPGEFTVAKKYLERQDPYRELTSNDVVVMAERLGAAVELQEQALKQAEEAKRWWAETDDGDPDALRAGVTCCRRRMLGEVPLVDGDAPADLMAHRASEVIFVAAMEDYGEGNNFEINHVWRRRELSHAEIQERAEAACAVIEEGEPAPNLRAGRDMVRIWVNQWPDRVTPAEMHRVGCLLLEDVRLRAKAASLAGSN